MVGQQIYGNEIIHGDFDGAVIGSNFDRTDVSDRNPGEPQVQRRADGRWVMVSERGTEDGGTVAVDPDITELKQREAP